MGKTSILLVFGLAVNVGLLSYHLLSRMGDAVENYTDYYETTAARNIANAAVELTIQQLNDNPLWREGFNDVPFADGSLSATVTDTSIGGENHVHIAATGEYNGQSKTGTVLLKVEAIGFLPDAVRGGVTANSDVRTLGNMQIDGREHSIDGTLIPNSGKYGVSTVGSYLQGGSSDAGGTAGGADFPPSSPADPGTIEENSSWGAAGFPDSPDKVMGGPSNGYPEGRLKAIAMSGLNGSQYVTNPADLSLPLSGVTYVELASGDVWVPINFGGVSTGILVVHNSAGNAKMKNLDSRVFNGLIITDDIEHIHTTITGAIVSLTTSPTGNCVGNGNGEILYSSEAIMLATESAGGVSSGEYTVVSYWE